ncbi:MAG: hypothetical protein ACREEM_32520 [Blastocatellia bacterium]
MPATIALMYPESMSTQMVTIHVDAASAAILGALQEKAEARGQTLDSLLRPLVEDEPNWQPEVEERPLAELLEGLIGAVDSSVADPSSPPHHTEFGRLLIEKFRKQGLKFP